MQGKSTLLRAIACRQISIPDMFHIVHVEQECTGDDRTALQTVVQADQEREWLLKMEKDLVDEVRLKIECENMSSSVTIETTHRQET